MKRIYLLITLLISITGFTQADFLSAPKSISTESQPDWTRPALKDAVDTCGAYFNNYVGLVKTTDVYFEEMRTGNIDDFTPYAGRGQRFHANQPIEVSGLQFYSFQNNDLIDSLMVVTLLYDYDADIDSVGAELARDTVWVKHTEFTPLLVDLEVDSYFDEPVLVEEDYIIALYTPTNDSLKIITNDPGGDGDGEGVSFAYYDNPFAPGSTGWYPTPLFGPAYDLDYLINPLVRYQLHDDFLLNMDSVCPNEISAACTEYMQVANFSDPHYNRFHEEPEGKVMWNWGDGFQNAELLSLCHTYMETGTFTITLTDSIRRHDYFDFTCAVELTKTIVVIDSTEANANGTSTGLTGMFDGEAPFSSSVSWDFGDGETSTEEDPSHTYSELGTYNVWFYAYGPCNTDSALVTITLDDVSITENELSISIFPNPSDEIVTIQGIHAGSSIELINVLGETLYRTENSSTQLSIETKDFAPGTYFIRMRNSDRVSTKKIIIKH